VKDRFNRTIDYLRIAVTDRCNLRCHYCIPLKNIHWLPHDQILSLEEIIEAAKSAIKLGMTKIRLTGGEPLMRKNIVYLVSEIAKISGLKDFSLTTNGTLLVRYAKALKQAGLNRINISLDTLDPMKYHQITGGNLKDVLEGIEAALATKFHPIKINCVVNKEIIPQEIKHLKKFAEEKKLLLRFIPLMNLQKGNFQKVEGGNGGDCTLCNRLRLLCDGTLRPCLFSDIGFNIREFGFEKSFKRAIQAKPECGLCTSSWMYQVGG